MALDCNTPTGRIYINWQADCLARLEKAWDVKCVCTNDQESADVDAFAIRESRISAVMEVKSREMDLPQLRKFGSYLITFEKLLKLRSVAVALCVPGLVVVSLLKDKQIVFWKICDKDGNFLVPLEGKTTKTQATCNGGQANRYNAYLSLSDMTVISE